MHVTPTVRMGKLASYFDHHEKRGKCILCKGENFFCPGMILCGYGKYLVERYDRILDSIWEGSHLDDEPESLLEFRPGRTRYWLGKLFGEWGDDWEWHHKRWFSRSRELLARVAEYAESHYMRNLQD